MAKESLHLYEGNPKLTSLKLTANAPENRPKPKRKPDRIPTIHFQVLTIEPILTTETTGKHTGHLQGGFSASGHSATSGFGDAWSVSETHFTHGTVDG